MLSNTIFLHFFDIHYLKEKGEEQWSAVIFREASLATKIAILGADNIIIPASSYFESQLCQSIIDEYSEIQFLGIFRLVGNAHNITEFIDFKKYQYQFNKETHESYYNEKTESFDIPFSKRHSSSTKDISRQWKDLLIKQDLAPIFSGTYSVEIPKNIEYLWHEIPETLEGKPFIVDNVYPLLFNQQQENIFAINILHSHINQYYFNSYTKEYDAGVITDLNRLQSNYPIEGYGINLPFNYIIREFNRRGKYDFLLKATPNELIIFKESDEWSAILTTAISNKNTRESTNQSLITKKKQLKGNDILLNTFTPQINILNGDIHMRDNYSAGQAGAQGPNAQAHDINFYQIWNQNQNEMDLGQLSVDLSKLREELGKTASTVEQHAEIGIIANAEIEAKAGNGVKVIEFLSKATKWSFQTATALGVAVAANAIKVATG